MQSQGSRVLYGIYTHKSLLFKTFQTVFKFLCISLGLIFFTQIISAIDFDEHSISLSQFFLVFVFCVLYTTTRNIFPLNVHTVLIRSIRYLRGLVLFYNPGFFILCHKGFLIIIFVPALENIKDVHVFLLQRNVYILKTFGAAYIVIE